MSKNLNDEYKTMINDDLPDLWDRISDSLPEKNAESLKTVPFRKPGSSRIFRYAGIVAACACAVILVPVALSVMSSSKDSSLPNQMISSDTMNTAKDNTQTAEQSEKNQTVQSLEESDAAAEAMQESSEATEAIEATEESSADTSSHAYVYNISFSIQDSVTTADGREAFLCELQEDYPEYGLNKGMTITVIFPADDMPSPEDPSIKEKVFCSDLAISTESDGSVIYLLSSDSEASDAEAE